MKKFSIIVLSIVVLGAGIYSQRGDIALRILPKGAEALLASPKID